VCPVFGFVLSPATSVTYQLNMQTECVGNNIIDQQQQITMFTNNDDALFRIMEFLGPRHVCLGLGSTCHELRLLSQRDSLWKVFWEARCLFNSEPASSGGGDTDDENDNTDAIGPHGAAMVFRHAMHTMKLTCTTAKPTTTTAAMRKYNEDINVFAIKSDDDTISLYRAYIQQHTAMKQSNLRVEIPASTTTTNFGVAHQIPPQQPSLDKHVTIEQAKLVPRTCTQTWPGQLSLIDAHANVEDQNNNNPNNRGVVTCRNSAVVWCDHPRCHYARCGEQGCLRSYRFALPVRWYYDHSVLESYGRIECSERSYDNLSFVQCSWCRVSFCAEHAYSAEWVLFTTRKGQRNDEDEREDNGGRIRNPTWYKCDECNVSSCPDCISQVFLTSLPNMNGCRVVTAGKVCHRTVCPQCIWYVGRKKLSNQSMLTGNVPGGDYSKIAKSEICTVRGIDLRVSNSSKEQTAGNLEWDEYETCCSKCLRHVDFRWRELAQVRDSFHGFMP